jgi:hypothetical protein
VSYPAPLVVEQIVIGYQDGIGGFGRVVLEITPGSKFVGEISHHFPTCIALNDHLVEVYLEAGVDGNLEILDEGVLDQAFVMEGGADNSDGAHVFKRGDSTFVSAKE